MTNNKILLNVEEFKVFESKLKSTITTIEGHYKAIETALIDYKSNSESSKSHEIVIAVIKAVEDYLELLAKILLDIYKLIDWLRSYYNVTYQQDCSSGAGVKAMTNSYYPSRGGGGGGSRGAATTSTVIVNPPASSTATGSSSEKTISSQLPNINVHQNQRQQQGQGGLGSGTIPTVPSIGGNVTTPPHTGLDAFSNEDSFASVEQTPLDEFNIGDTDASIATSTANLPGTSGNSVFKKGGMIAAGAGLAGLGAISYANKKQKEEEDQYSESLEFSKLEDSNPNNDIFVNQGPENFDSEDYYW